LGAGAREQRGPSRRPAAGGLAVSARARAFPPLSPPGRPSATAAAFFFIFGISVTEQEELKT